MSCHSVWEAREGEEPPPIQLCSARASGWHHTTVPNLPYSLTKCPLRPQQVPGCGQAQEGGSEHGPPRRLGASAELLGALG